MAAMTDEEDQVPIDPTSGRRADWTMDLLREIREQAVDPSYAVVTQAETRAAQAERRHDQDDHGKPAPHTQENGSTASDQDTPPAAPDRRRRRRLHVGTIAVLLIAGLGLGTAWRTTALQQPVTAAERGDLVRRVEAAQAHQADQQRQISELEGEVHRMRGRAGTWSAAAEHQSKQADAAAVSRVSGPGVKITVDDSKASSEEGRLTDTDLRQVVNGLWGSGAEAIAINDRRLSSKTAIRTAGSAITVNYASISAPYVIKVIGPAQTLPGQFAQTDGGTTLQYHSDNFRVRYQMETLDALTLPESHNVSVSYSEPR